MPLQWNMCLQVEVRDVRRESVVTVEQERAAGVEVGRDVCLATRLVVPRALNVVPHGSAANAEFWNDGGMAVCLERTSHEYGREGKEVLGEQHD